MARGYKTDPPVYFGLPGKLVQLPWPQGGVQAPVDRSIYDFMSGDGNHRVSSLVGTSRGYSLAWNALHQSTYDLLNEHWVGQNGPGPFVLIDPSRPNLLRGNQSGATGEWNDARGFTTGFVTAGGNGTLSSNAVAANIHRARGRRSLQWSFSGTLVSTVSIGLDSAFSTWPGIPVLQNAAYSFSFWVKPDGVVDSSIDVGLRLVWYRVDGTVSRTDTVAPATVTAWTQKTTTQTSPADAAYCKPVITATGSTITTGGSLFIDELLFEQDSAVNPWAPGTGVLPVAMLSFPEAIPFDGLFRLQPAMALREVR